MRCASRPSRFSLRAQLLAGALASVIVTAVLALLVLMALWQSGVLNRFSLRQEAVEIADDLRFDADGRLTGLDQASHNSWAYRLAPSEVKYIVMDEGGRILLASEPRAAALTTLAGGPSAQPARFQVVEDGVRLEGATARFRIEGRDYWIQVARSERLDEFLTARLGDRIFNTGLGVVLIALVLFTISVQYTTHRLLRPLRELSAAAAAITPARLDARLDGGSLPRELVPVVDGFNEALERVEQAFRVQQDFLSTAAHELKTPLALVRGQIEMSEIPQRRQLLGDLDGMARQVAQLLHLAEVSEACNFSLARIDVREVCHDLFESLGRLAQARGVHLASRLPNHPVVAHADRSALYVLVKNLLENAIHHSAPGDIVSLELDATRLTVRDEGPGVADADLPHLFERFWRGPQSSGAGLGLAICQEIAQAHGWSLLARKLSPGMAFELYMGR